MKTYFTILVLLFLHLQTYTQNIELDNSFADNGVLVIPSDFTSEIYLIETDKNNNVYCASSSSMGPGTGEYKLRVSKCDENGVLDPSFGVNGTSAISFLHSEFPLDIKILSNSKILISGSAYTGNLPEGPGPHIGFLLRLNADGSLDTSFGEMGISRPFFNPSQFSSIICLEDLSIILAGNVNGHGALLRLNKDGILDTEFGFNGVKLLSTNGFMFVLWKTILVDDNKLLSIGSDASFINPRISYCQTDIEGNFDQAFGIEGKVVIDLYNGLPNTDELLTQVRKSPGSNKFYLAGYHISAFLIRINPDGSFDESFANNGVLTHGFSFSDFDLQEDGKIIIAGSKTLSDYNSGYSFIRYDYAGNLDLSFNNGNSFDIDLSPKNDYLQCLKLLSPKSLIVGGNSCYNSEIPQSTIGKFNLGISKDIFEILDSEAVQIYPNPFNNSFSVKSHSAIRNLRLLDIAGKELPIEIDFKSDIFQVNTNLRNAVYILKIELDDANVIYKRIIRSAY